MLILPIFLGLYIFIIWNHRRISRLPRCRTDLSEFISMLECLHKSQVLVDIPPHWKICNRHMPQNRIMVNYISRPHRCATHFISRIFNQTSIPLGNLFGKITEHRNVNWTQAALLSIFFAPFFMRIMGVDRASYDLAIKFFKLRVTVRKLNYFSGAHESKV
jgi:hypothetical protein